MRTWKMMAAAAVAAVGLSSQADAQVSVGIPGGGSVTFGNGSAYYSPNSAGYGQGFYGQNSYGYGQSYSMPSYGGNYGYGNTYVPSGFATGSYNYPTQGTYYSGTNYAYPATYGTNYSYPTTYGSGYSYPMTYGSGYESYPSYNTSGYYPNSSGYYNQGYGGNYNTGYYNQGYGGNYNTTFGQGFGSGVMSGALGVPNYGYGGYYGGSNVQGTVGNYLGRELGRAIR